MITHLLNELLGFKYQEKNIFMVSEMNYNIRTNIIALLYFPNVLFKKQINLDQTLDLVPICIHFNIC